MEGAAKEREPVQLEFPLTYSKQKQLEFPHSVFRQGKSKKKVKLLKKKKGKK